MKIYTEELIIDMDILMKKGNLEDKSIRDLKLYRDLVEEELKRTDDLRIYLSKINREIIDRQKEEINQLKQQINTVD